jgi:hypothetical protein
MNQDLEHLRLLAIFHYVVAAFAGLFSLFPVFHLVFGVAMLTGRFPDGQGGGEVPAFLGWFFVIFAATWIVCGLAFAICLFLAGRYLAQRRRYLFCLVVAGLACMFMPFGTVLGVFTIIVLMRPSVRELFGEAPASPAGSPSA